MFSAYRPDEHGVRDERVRIRTAAADDLPGIVTVAASRGEPSADFGGALLSGLLGGQVFSVVNARNLASLELHRRHGFVELARAARFAGIDFDGGSGVLLRSTRKE